MPHGHHTERGRTCVIEPMLVVNLFTWRLPHLLIRILCSASRTAEVDRYGGPRLADVSAEGDISRSL